MSDGSEHAQDEDQASWYDDSPQRFRETNPTTHFQGSSGVLFEQAMAQTRMAISLADPNVEDMPLVFVNNAFVNLTGYREEELLGRNCRFLQGPETDMRVVRKVREALAREDVIVVELLNYRKDGSTFWNALHLGPIYNEAGDLIYYFGSQWNVSDVHAARADEKHARIMARELSHRMKNMFSVIGGLVTVAGRTRGIQNEAAEINDRIRALGRAFETTLDDVAVGSVNLTDAIRAVLAPYDPEGNRIAFEGEDLRVDPNLISTMGLTLHELAVNATKYGALGPDGGKVTITWEKTRQHELDIDWIERGGPSVTKPDSLGSGLGITETLLGTIGGQITPNWDPNGLRVHLRIPRASKENV